MKKIVKNSLEKFGLILNLSFGGMLLLIYLSALIPPDIFWPAAIMGLLYPFLLAVNLLFLVYYIIKKSKWVLVSIFAILIGYQHLLNLFQPIPSLKETGKGIKIVTYNVHYFLYEFQNSQTNPPRTIKFLQSSNPDIICLQEAQTLKTGRLSPDAIMETIPGIKYYQTARSSLFANPMTFSKHPIVSHGEIRFEHSANMVLFSDIVVKKKDTIRVYNCHFQSYKISPEEYSLTDPDKSGTRDQQVKEAKMITKKLALAFSIRAKQARTVASHIRKCPYPVIVCGDFNDTPYSYTYNILSKNLHDSFSDAGFGFSSTYNGFMNTLRIDYILFSSSMTALKYQTDHLPYSDHFPVTAVIKIP